ncbi:PqqD family peptide modification chaperone [Microbacterium sp. NPDC089698]|uniref:PqqD family peptide modification chaperone n=1 Tax=Microbacterium sp. NPDC089698 TaxID=3364200 RepID=UPI00380D5D32
MSGYRISPEAAWIEASEHDGPDHLVWAAHLGSGAQFEFSDTGWLIWMLLSDGIGDVAALTAELTRIHAELSAGASGSPFDESAVSAFLADLLADGLLVVND